MALSAYLLILYLRDCTGITNLGYIRQYFASELGLHTNDLANFYIIVFPALLSNYFIKKNKQSILSICITIPVFGILYSRTAYVMLFFSIIFYFMISRRTKLLPVFLGIAFILFSITSYTAIKERVLYKTDTKSVDSITAGRVDNLWKPLIYEYLQNPEKMFLGNGRRAIFYSDSISRGMILDTGHPHNMYLEMILDCGILGLVFFIYFFSVLLLKIKNAVLSTENPVLKEHLFAVLTAIISFLISGLVGRSFFPQINNSFLWIILGYTFILLKINLEEAELCYD